MADLYTITLLTAMRKVIATRMAEASLIPHFRVVTDIELDALLKLRRELMAHQPATSLSLTDLLIKSCARALMDVPAVNAQWMGMEIHQYQAVDIAVVIAMEGGGLSTPIIRSAESKSIWEISREVRELTAKAQEKALKVDEIFGGSFTVSNLGTHGVDEFDAIINAPQCAVLAVGAARPRVVASREREMRIATTMRVTMSCDHRAIDGTTAASFLSALRHRVEDPEHLCETRGRPCNS